MKNRFLALLICAILVFSIIPFGKNIKASQTNNNAKQLNTPEQMAAVMREKANNNIARMKGKITQSQVNATIKQKLIVKTKDEIENTYGANSVYYYTVGNYQILFYDTAEEAKNFDFKATLSADGAVTIAQDNVHYLYSGFTSKWKIYSSTTTPPTEPGSYVMTVVTLGGDYQAAPIKRGFKITK